MKMWRSVVTLMGVVFFLVTSVAVSPAKAVDVTTVMEATPGFWRQRLPVAMKPMKC